jgi:hypothetical protein
MAKTGRSGLEAITASLPRKKGGLPPVERWNPPFCGDIDMKIEADGTWFYQKTPIGRPALVKLTFRTNVDDWVEAGPGHALKFIPEPATGGLKPYLHVRRELWAKVTRALFYDLVALGEERDVAGKRMFGVASNGEFFAMAEASALKEFA